MPWVIIITMVFAAFMLAVFGIGVLRLVLAMERFLQNGGSYLVAATALGQDAGGLILAGATLFACIKRPTWGRVVSMVFAALFSVLMVIGLVFPDPHAPFPIAPGAEQAGAYAGEALMTLGVAAYLWSMVMGAKARAYFASA